MTEKEYSPAYEISGKNAMFTRPDTGSSPVTYPVPTKSALKSITESVVMSKNAYFETKRVEICTPIVFHKYSTNYQFIGRNCRNGGYNDSKAVAFTINDDNFTHNREFNNSRSVFDGIIKRGKLPAMTITDAATESFDSEMKKSYLSNECPPKGENACEFANVAKEFRVIDEDTITVLVNTALADKINQGEYVSPTELQRCSVNIRHSMMKKIKFA